VRLKACDFFLKSQFLELELFDHNGVRSQTTLFVIERSVDIGAFGTKR